MAKGNSRKRADKKVEKVEVQRLMPLYITTVARK